MTNSLSEVSPGSMFCQRYLVHHESILYKNQETCTVHWSPLTCKTPSAKWVPARGKQASKALTAQLGSCGVSRAIVGSSVGSTWTSARIRVGKNLCLLGNSWQRRGAGGCWNAPAVEKSGFTCPLSYRQVGEGRDIYLMGEDLYQVQKLKLLPWDFTFLLQQNHKNS